MFLSDSFDPCKVVSSNPAHGEVCLIQLYLIKFGLWLGTGQWFSPGTSIPSTNKTDCHNVTYILLKVALNTINQTRFLWSMQCQNNLSLLTELTYYKKKNQWYTMYIVFMCSNLIRCSYKCTCIYISPILCL
jgi:hypothetical protein